MLRFIHVWLSFWRRTRTEIFDILTHFQIYWNPLLGGNPLQLKVVFSFVCPEGFALLLCGSRTSENVWKKGDFVCLFVCLFSEQRIRQVFSTYWTQWSHEILNLLCKNLPILYNSGYSDWKFNHLYLRGQNSSLHSQLNMPNEHLFYFTVLRNPDDFLFSNCFR